MPKGRPFSDEEQKKIDARIAEAMKLVAKAHQCIDRQRQMGNMPQGKNQATPFQTFVPRMDSSAPGMRMPTASTAGSVNIVGGTIGNAVIGSDQPVSFNQHMKVFGKGARRTNYKILGGTFKQANIGGESTTYNNKRSNVTTSESSTGISSEDLLLEILLKGVSITQLTQLLEKGYSLANITFALPDNQDHRDKMIDALLH